MGTKLWKVGHFNPLPRKEGDPMATRALPVWLAFQSTPS